MLKMKTRYFAIIIAGLFLFLSAANSAFAEDITIKLPDALKGLSISGLGYLDYSNGVSAKPGGKEESYNKFSVTRGYLTVQKTVNPWLSGRVTTDIHQDSDGSYRTRLKYLYAQLKPMDLGILTQMNVEIGLGHTPWLDFEEHINPYRCQGTMAIERAGVTSSADVGVSIHGNFDGKLADAKEKIGNTHYDGRFGSWHIGVYNGGGYHASEANNNKVVEGRLTFRPLPDVIPGLQVSYLGMFGKGNVSSDKGTKIPDFNVNLGMLSYQNPIVILTAQYFQTKGNAAGSWVDSNGSALKTEGYSFFGNVKLAMISPKLSVFARYDHFDGDKDNKNVINATTKLSTPISDAAYNMTMAGLAYDVFKGSQVVVDYQTIDYKNDSGGQGDLPIAGNNLGNDKKVQVVWQIGF